MALNYLKRTAITIPSGYSVGDGAGTADSERIYFAASHATQNRLLLFDMDGTALDSESFNIVNQSIDAVCVDSDNVFLIQNSASLSAIASVYAYSKDGIAGRRFTLQSISDNQSSLFERVQGAVWLNDQIVVLLRRDTDSPRLSIARFRADGSYINGSFQVLSISGNPISMALGGMGGFVLYESGILALDRGFAGLPSEDITLNVQQSDPSVFGFNGAALVVLDTGYLYFYGSEQSISVAPSTTRVRQFKGLKRHSEQFDLLRQAPDGTISAVGLNKRGIKQSVTQQDSVPESVDLTDVLNLFRITLEWTEPTVQEGDVIAPSAGVNNPTVLPSERYELKGTRTYGTKGQVLYCVRVTETGEADTIINVGTPR